MDTPDTPPRRPDTAQIVIGLIILSMGGILLLDRLSPGHHVMRAWWPLVLIAMGAAKMLNSAPPDGREHGGRRSGAWLVLVGLWGMVNEWRLFGLTYGTSWPLLVMASGAMMVWRSFETRPHSPARREP